MRLARLLAGSGNETRMFAYQIEIWLDSEYMARKDSGENAWCSRSVVILACQDD